MLLSIILPCVQFIKPYKSQEISSWTTPGIICNMAFVMVIVGLRRCGKSCRLRWLNYLRPNIKHGEFTENEDRVICSMYASIGSRWVKENWIYSPIYSGLTSPFTIMMTQESTHINDPFSLITYNFLNVTSQKKKLSQM